MDKILELLKKLGIELTADQTAQFKEVAEKEFVSAADAAKTAAKVEELTKQLAERDSDLERLKANNKSEELEKQFDELNKKYAEATDKLAAQETDYAAEKLLSGYRFASERVKNSVLAEFNGIPIIRVPSARMKSAYTFNDGKTAGQQAGGFVPTEDAVQINWIICPRNAPIAISKTDNFKIFEPAVNQKADAWLIQYRKYHDLWIKEKALETVRVCAAPSAEVQV